MAKMRRLFAKGPGAIGMGFINFVSRCVHLVLDCPTRLSSALTSLSIAVIPFFVMLLILLPLVFYLYRATEGFGGLIMALPVTQGGIDYPDGGFSSGGPVYPIKGDLAELAARVRSPVVYDRRGNVLFLSDFDTGLEQFSRSVVGTGAQQIASAATHISGAYCLQMDTSGTTNQVSTATTQIAIPNPDTRMGLEAAFAVPNAEIGFDIVIAVYLNPNLYQYTLTYRTDMDRLFIHSPTGSGILSDNLKIREGIRAWHRMKLVVDLESNTYIRVMFDEDEFDVSDYAGFSYTTTELDRIDIRLTGYSRDATSRTIYWDDIIVTQNEPTQE
jgi:hypothetical protein